MITRVTVTVVGSLNEDVLVTVDRLPARGETVIGQAVTLAPGGKGANQAAAAGLLGAGVHMVGRVGADPAGERQVAALQEAGVDVDHLLTTAAAETGTATIAVERNSGENLILVVPGANALLAPADVDVEPVRRAGVVLLQLEVPLPTVAAAAAAGTGTIVLTPAPAVPLPGELLARVDVLVPNEPELLTLTQASPAESSLGALAALARSLGVRAVVITLGERGALVVDGDDVVAQAPPPVRAVDTTGAGDCFAGALAVALAVGADLREAARYAVAAASLSTTGVGARGALPDDDAVRRALSGLPAPRPVR